MSYKSEQILLAFYIPRFNQQQIENIQGKKLPGSSKKQNLNFLFARASLPGGTAGKESTCNVGDLGSIPGLGRSPGEGNGYPLQYSGLENSIDCIVHRVAKSRTQL